jgi:hypothetical protein
MITISKIPYARIIVGISILLGICACERDSYTTWNCNSQEEKKLVMVLRKAQMEFKGAKYDYCGSLGTQSYFDQKCPAHIEQSSFVFTPSTGLLKSNGQELNCVAL